MLSRKQSRSIEVDGETYRWSVSGDSGYNVLVAQHAKANGQRLELIVPVAEDGGPRAITPSFAAQVIKDALQIGWQPGQKASPLQLTLLAEGSFEIRHGLIPAYGE